MPNIKIEGKKKEVFIYSPLPSGSCMCELCNPIGHSIHIDYEKIICYHGYFENVTCEKTNTTYLAIYFATPNLGYIDFIFKGF